MYCTIELRGNQKDINALLFIHLIIFRKTWGRPKGATNLSKASVEEKLRKKTEIKEKRQTACKEHRQRLKEEQEKTEKTLILLKERITNLHLFLSDQEYH